MSKNKDPEHLPNCEHLESTSSGKDEVPVMVPDDQQSIIRKKVSTALRISSNLPNFVQVRLPGSPYRLHSIRLVLS